MTAAGEVRRVGRRLVGGIRLVKLRGRQLRALGTPVSVTNQRELADLHDALLTARGFNNTNPATNGELAAVRSVCVDRPLVVFDVGANRGNFTALVCDALEGDVRIEALEPSPTAFAKLDRRFAGATRVRTHNVGLGDADGSATLVAEAAGSSLASLYDRAALRRDSRVREDVRIRRLDSFCADLGIARIDYLKIDSEGHDLAVLRGAGSLLDGERIRAVQFEHGGTAPDARVFLRDFFELLAPTYLIHRVLPDGLWPLDKYRERDEISVYANYVALPATESS